MTNSVRSNLQNMFDGAIAEYEYDETIFCLGAKDRSYKDNWKLAKGLARKWGVSPLDWIRLLDAKESDK